MPRLTPLLLLAALLSACAAHPGSTSRAAVRVLEQSGLAAEPRTFTFTDYGDAPRVGDGVQFAVPAAGPAASGHVVHVTNPHERRALNDYYAEQPGSRSTVLGPLVLQMSGDPSGAAFARAQAALREWQAREK